MINVRHRCGVLRVHLVYYQHIQWMMLVRDAYSVMFVFGGLQQVMTSCVLHNVCLVLVEMRSLHESASEVIVASKIEIYTIGRFHAFVMICHILQFERGLECLRKEKEKENKKRKFNFFHFFL